MSRPTSPRLLAVLLILVVSVVAAGGAWRFEEARARDEQDARAQATTTALRLQIATVIVSLEGMRGLIEGTGRAEAATFAPFAQYALQRRGGLLAAWAPRVERAGRSAFEREEGHPITERSTTSGPSATAADRPVYYPIALTEPVARGRALLGLDIGESVAGRAVIDEARDTGLTRISSPVVLPGSDTVLVFLRAVYGGGTVQNSVASRRATFTGMVVTANRLQEISAAVLQDLPAGTTMEIREGDRVILPAVGSLDRASAETVTISGRTWTVRVAGAPGASIVLPATVLAAGLLLGALVWLLIETITRRQAELERRVEERTAELAIANGELEAFSYSVSHDLRSPLRSVSGLSAMLIEDHGDQLDADAQGLLGRIRIAAERMGELIDDLLGLARVSRADMHREEIDLGAIAGRVAANLRDSDPGRSVELLVAPGLRASGDPRLMRVVFENLLGNAWKFTRDVPRPVVRVGATDGEGGRRFFVTDNGAGFDMAYVDKLFGPFQRLHRTDEFEGTGIGLATVQRIVRRHGGEIGAEGEVDRGATISFTLPDAEDNR